MRVLRWADFLVGTLLEGDACGRAGRLKCGQSMLGCALNVVKLMGVDCVERIDVVSCVMKTQRKGEGISRRC